MPRAFPNYTASCGTAKSIVLAAKVMPWQGQYVTIAGDPEHDIIAFRKTISKRSPLRCAAVLDHADILHRLAAPLPPMPPRAEVEGGAAAALSADAQALLSAAVAAWKQDLQPYKRTR